MKYGKWHKKFVVFPRRVSNNYKENTYVFLRTVYRKEVYDICCLRLESEFQYRLPEDVTYDELNASVETSNSKSANVYILELKEKFNGR